MNETLLATDLDGTLIGDDHALKQLNDYLSPLRAQHKLKLAYVTGRSLQLYKELEAEKLLLSPDALVTAVGTEIYWNGAQPADNWPPVGEWDRVTLESKLKDIKGLEPQPDSEQRQYKLSYFLKQNPEALTQVYSVLENFNVDIIYSHELYLDVLPKGIHKGSALRYLASKWEIDTSGLIACGDSANDTAMLEVSNGVVVNNAKQELRDWANQQQPSGKLYIANAPFAAGILEGLKHFQARE